MTPFTRRTLAATLALSAVSVSTARAADSVSGTRSEELRETSHAIVATLAPRHATLVVRRTVHNGGPRHDQALFHIFLPGGAVATRLRTLGVAEGQPRWFEGELMEAEAAAERYRELTGIGGYYPKDPALLSWRSQDHLALQVFPCAPGQPKTVEYTLQVPTEYEDGRHHLRLSRLGTKELPAKLVLGDGTKDRIFVGGKPVAPGAEIALGADVDVALERRSPPMLDGALAVARFADSRVLVRTAIEAAPRLSKVPRGAAIVVVIDASRSLSKEQIAAGVAAARATLSHFPDARVEVITFDREVRPRFGRFLPVSEAIDELQVMNIERRNGSRVDDALAKADSLLAALPANKPSRVLLLTDLRTRAALDPDSVHFASRALLHVGVVRPGSPFVARDDDDERWARVARGTGGLVWRASASPSRSDAAAMRTAYEEWARPLRIDRFEVAIPGVPAEDLETPPTLDEGKGFTDLRITETKVRAVTVRGELWSTPIERRLAPDEAEADRWSALVFGSELLGQLSEAEMMILAKRGRAVSPVTSYLAIEPGVRPSTEGLEEGVGHGRIGTIGHGSGAGTSMRVGVGFDRQGFLEAKLRDALRACGGGSMKATVLLETTLDEIVEVHGVSIPSHGAAAIERCVTEAAWNVELPPAFSDEQRSYVVEL